MDALLQNGGTFNRDVLKLAIDSLTGEQRLVMLLRYADDLTPREIGLVMNVPPARVAEIHADAMRVVMHRLTVKHANVLPV